MKWHWLIDKEVLGQLRVYLDRGTNDDADFSQNIILQFTTVKCDLVIYIHRI